MHSLSFDIGAFSPQHFVTGATLTLGEGVVWTGTNQTYFGEYHTRLVQNVKDGFQNAIRQQRGRWPTTSMMISRVEPVWLEPKLASEFIFCAKGSTCHVSPNHQENIYNTTLTDGRQVHQLLQTANQFIPNTPKAVTARLPANITFSVVGPSAKYIWVRVMAWNIYGQVAYGSRSKPRIYNKIKPFDAVIASILPSGHLNAIVGELDFCGPRQIDLLDQNFKHVKQFFCNHL
ncbi:hypothetical protein DSO57_1026323 [Entomophthora muscae]|uniref:Uncharacterized protein n=1 Tax=Entomophthora muscae TaxID=34485 RepID=A0ACC2UB58_9FUNG|nr:hypothetical protein DSO57_1026323 [Entomophthora muscae]